MKISIGKMFILLAIILSLAAVQATWAKAPNSCNVTVEGTVTAIDYGENAITVDGTTTVYGVPLAYLATWLDIELNDSSVVSITAHQCPFTGKLMACTLSVDGGETISLRQGSLKKTKGSGDPATETNALSVTGNDCPCNCNCYCLDEVNCDCTCKCTEDCPENQYQYKKGKQ